LSDEAIRVLFYDKLSLFSRLLKLALSSLEWHRNTSDKEIEAYKFDLGFFSKLRASVRNIYSDTVDFKAYEKQIQKLIDKHVTSQEKVIGTAAKADMIASRTDKHINEKMEEDPAFYKRFSELLKDTIRAYRERRISEAEYLKRVSEIKDNVLNHTGSDIPEVLRAREVAQAFYGVTLEHFKTKIEDDAINREIASSTGIGIDDIIRAKVLDDGTPKIDWQSKTDLIGQLEIAIGDFLMDEIRDEHNIALSFGEINEMAEKYIDIAKIRYR